MKLDNQRQKEILLQLFNASQFPGQAIEEVFDLKKALKSAEIENNPKMNAKIEKIEK